MVVRPQRFLGQNMINTFKRYFEKIEEEEKNLARQSEDLNRRKEIAENIFENFAELDGFEGLSNAGHDNDSMTIWGGGYDHCSPLPSDPVVGKLNLAVKLSGKPFVYRSIYTSIRNLMLERELPSEIYNYILKTKVEDIVLEVEAISLRSEFRSPEQERILESSKENGLVSLMEYWPTRHYITDSKGNTRLLKKEEFFCSVSS